MPLVIKIAIFVELNYVVILRDGLARKIKNDFLLMKKKLTVMACYLFKNHKMPMLLSIQARINFELTFFCL
jgi:hypothetical protein